MAQPELELCPHCLKPHAAGTHFCLQCSAPLTPHAATDPYLGIFARGFAIQEAAAKPYKPIILIGIWLMAIPSLVVGVSCLYFPMAFPSKMTTWAETLLCGELGLGILALWGAILFKTTRNFLRLRQALRAGGSQGEEEPL